MSQQIFEDKFWPLGGRSPGDLRPGAAILQTRDGKDEPITLAGNMVLRADGLWVPVSSTNRLPVDVGGEAATEGTLIEVLTRLNSIITRLNETLDVDVGGQIHADVDLGDITVDLGVVKQGGKDASAEPWEVQLPGQTTLPKNISHVDTVQVDKSYVQGSTAEIVYDTEDPCILLSGIIATTSKGANIRFQPRNADSVAETMRWRTPWGAWQLSPLNLHDRLGEIGEFALARYDETKDEYVISVRSPGILLPTGFRLWFDPPSAGAVYGMTLRVGYFDDGVED